MKRMLWCGCILLLLPLLLGMASPADTELVYRRRITAPTVITDNVGVITADSLLYANTDDRFTAVRLYALDSKEVPYVVRIARGRQTVQLEHQIAARISELEELPDNRLSLVVVRAEKQQPQQPRRIPSGIRITTANNNFEKKVAVYGSDDNQHWQLVAEQQLIFDYTRFADVRNTIISFAEHDFVYYKLIIDNVTQPLIFSLSHLFTKYAPGEIPEEYTAVMRFQEVLTIDRVDFISREEQHRYGQKKLVSYPLAIAQVAENKPEKATDIYLNSGREPLTRLMIETRNINFKRRVVVAAKQKSDADSAWRQLTAAEVYSLSAGTFLKDHLFIDLPDHEHNRYDLYRVRIFNYDNPALDVTAVKAEGYAHEIVFFPAQAKTLTVQYGGRPEPPPLYDVAAVLAELPPIDAERWEFGAELVTEDIGQKPALFIKPETLLIVTVTAMVLLLSFLIIASVQRIERP